MTIQSLQFHSASIMSSHVMLSNCISTFASASIHCPACRRKMTLEHFLDEHAEKEHGVNSNVSCIFCLGQYVWKDGTMENDVNLLHRIRCFTTFIDKYRFFPSSEICKTCYWFTAIPRQMNGREPLNTSVDSDFEKPEWWIPEMEFFNETKGMYNDLMAIVKRFRLPKQDPNRLKWFHLMVKLDEYETFRKRLEPIRDEIVALPYWCLCDGPPAIHRHMIVACTPNSTFADMDFPESIERIKDAMDLLNCIQYVSQTQSSCDGTSIRSRLMQDNYNFSHFYINRPLSNHSIAFMSLLFEGGLDALLTQENKHKDVRDWMDKAAKVMDKDGNEVWGVAVKYTNFRFINCVVPLRRDIVFTDEVGPWYLTWLDGKRSYLKEDSDNFIEVEIESFRQSCMMVMSCVEKDLKRKVEDMV